MNLDEFRSLLDAHGSNFSSWPDEKRASANALAETSNEARALVMEAKSLESVLEQAPHYEPSPALRRRVAEIPLTCARRGRTVGDWSWWPFKTVFAPAVAMAAAAVMGVVTGTAVFAPVPGDVPLKSVPTSSTEVSPVNDEPSATNDSFSDAEVDDYFELAFATHLDDDPWQ